MPSRSSTSEDQEHPPARSGTPTAWTTLALLVLVAVSWLFFEPIACGVIRAGLSAACWWQGDQLRITQLSLPGNGCLQARGVEWLHGPEVHRSSLKSDWMILRPTPFWKLVHPGKKDPHRLFQELQLGKTKLLLDRRGIDEKKRTGGEKAPASADQRPPVNFLPASFSVGPTDLVIIGENYRVAVSGLSVLLPDRWTGGVSYNEAVLDAGAYHFPIPKGAASASWEGGTLHLGELVLGKEITLKELTLSGRPGGVDFGIRGVIGKGILRGDGTLGDVEKDHYLAVTLVGEKLALDPFSGHMGGGHRATGTISQARLTFRGNTRHPLEADSSLRLVAKDFQWDGRGWESLRLSASMTGRNLTLTEFRLQQAENEVTAEGQSRLPEDWHAALRAPFTASFHAQLEDAGTLAALGGPEFAQLGGGLSLEGEIHGSDNRANGYCNLTASGMKIRELTVDWMKGCLLFESDTTRLSNLDAWIGDDRFSLEGSVANSRPHAYKASAGLTVQNLTRRLSQLGIATATAIGGGGVKGSWQGSGSAEAHSGSFQAVVTEWISPLTKRGMSGSFEGSYTPDHFELTKAEFRQEDLKLGLKLTSSAKRLEATSIIAVRAGKTKALVEGEIALPLNASDLWQTGDALRTLAMGEPLSVRLALHGIKAEELAELLGQRLPFTGLLEGKFEASGTPESPEIHSSLQIARFATLGAPEPKDFSMTLDASKGMAAAEFVQQPAGNSPLRLKAKIPFHFALVQGKLRLADGSGPVIGAVSLRHVPLDGWAGLLGLKAWPLRQSTLDGTLALSGTVEKPSLDGAMMLEAREAALFGKQKQQLERLVLPVTLNSTTGHLAKGSATYGGQPITLSGTLGWGGAEAEGSLQLEGRNLPLTLGDGDLPWHSGGLVATSDADLLLTLRGTNNPLLGGTVTLHALSGEPLLNLIPCFAPPGIRIAYPAAGPGITGIADWIHDLQLDLSLKTDGALPVTAAAKLRVQSKDVTQLEANLHLVGQAATPQLTGTLTGSNLIAALPAGNFVIPEAGLKLEKQGIATLNAQAFGITRRGLCALTITGSLAFPSVSFEGSPAVNAPELLLALATPARKGFGIPTVSGEESAPGIFPQCIAWTRQEQLFPIPSTGWMNSRFGTNESAALGFFGAPWLWLQPARVGSKDKETATERR